MNLNPEYLARVYLTVFVLVFGFLFYAVYQQVVFVKKQRRDFLQNYKDDFYNSTLSEYLDTQFRNKVQDIQQIIQIKEKIKQINIKQKVYNTKLGPITNASHIVVIQVHSNAYYIRELLLCLSVSNGIENALLIFSHDYFSYEINELIKRINFVKYMQIFYPFSIQLHPKVFPGNDSQFCTDGYVCKESNLRDPQAAQLKHHWWWGANQVFDHMKITQLFNNTILFLEEGDYVTPDFLYVHTLLRTARYHCPFCDLLSMGAHRPLLSQYKKESYVFMEVWSDKVPRTGIAFDRRTWRDLKANSDVFCYYNDFKWDSSFRHVAEQKLEGNIDMAAIAGRRVFRLKQCDKKNKCLGVELAVAEAFVKRISKNLYPSAMIVVVRNEEEFNEVPAGLWGDVRDRELCMHFTKKSVWF